MQEKEAKLEEVIVIQALRIIQLEKDLVTSDFLGKIWQEKYYKSLPKEKVEVAE